MKKQLGLMALSTLLAVGAVHASEEDTVKYRHYLMEAVGGHMNNAVAIMKGEVPYKDQLAYHADSLAKAAPYVIPAFETKAMTDKSEALPKIWDNWADFEKASGKFEESAAAFSKAVASGDMAAMGAALGDLGKSCKGCHDDFMEEH